MESGLLTLDDLDVGGKTVILRVDINSPVHTATGELKDDNRIRKSVPTIRELAKGGARVVILAHQGDTEDYQNLISLDAHARRASELLGQPVEFVDDIVGPAALERVATLNDGEILLLNNVRFLTEEVSTFVRFVKLTPAQLAESWLVRKLAPLADLYVCEAFAAAHRYSPSLVGFTEVLPSAGGRLFVQELSALQRVREAPGKPCVFLLGGSRSADAFSMMEYVLANGTADRILTGGLTGEIMLLAKGYKLGERTEHLVADKGLAPFIEQSRELLAAYGDRIEYPQDLAYVSESGERVEIGLDDLPAVPLLVDIGRATVERYEQLMADAATIFINGPVGVYEDRSSALGTERLWRTAANVSGYTVIGGGDSVAAAKHFRVAEQMGYVCTAGGCMVRYMSGQQLPVVDALKQAAQRYQPVGA
ncbi:MAG: phosphoglycerate kinase [Anaerolineales bacterium]|nr:phosphoglycerate kinase [Anaerolineales bacterium]